MHKNKENEKANFKILKNAARKKILDKRFVKVIFINIY